MDTPPTQVWVLSVGIADGREDVLGVYTSPDGARAEAKPYLIERWSDQPGGTIVGWVDWVPERQRLPEGQHCPWIAIRPFTIGASPIWSRSRKAADG